MLPHFRYHASIILSDKIHYDRILQKLQDTYQSHEQQRRLSQDARVMASMVTANGKFGI